MQEKTKVSSKEKNDEVNQCFYLDQPKTQQDEYKNALEIIGCLSKLFSDNDRPYLPYRCHENIFCKFFHAENLGRKDCSVDAKKDKIGVGLKTWVGNDDQKIAEFDKLKSEYKDLQGIELCKKISLYRNMRIQTTMKMYGINSMIYHIVKRMPHRMRILEHVFEPIDIDNISILVGRGNSNNTYFTDGKHTYHFSTSKNTLYMLFKNLYEVDSFEVEIMDDPYEYLLNRVTEDVSNESLNSILFTENDKTDKICLRLYTYKYENKKKKKYVHEKSGLNQWNASGRDRDENEIYIPFPAEDRDKNKGFFPEQNEVFTLVLPDGQELSAKICQQNGKAIMSNPNKALGKWLLRDVLNIEPKTVITYEMLVRYDIDSVIFTKIADKRYSIDFSCPGTYEEFYDIDENIIEDE